ncbi:MAG: helix-turn-helix domain-containing protein [Candidatus Rokuibacteriota bacterium]
MRIGVRIRQLREARGFTQTALARRAKVGRITLVRIEQGTQDATVSTLERLARALEVRVREFFD